MHEATDNCQRACSTVLRASDAYAVSGTTGERCSMVLQRLDAIGGVAECGDLVELLRRQVPQPLSVLARWIASRDLVCVQYRAQTLVPLFQIDFLHARVRPGVGMVLDELQGFCDGELTMAEWFAGPNVWLGGAAPATLIGVGDADVVGAARADRFVARW